MRKLFIFVIVVLAFFSNVIELHAGRAIPDDHLRSAILVSLDDGTPASGFYFKDIKDVIYFVTARHVLFTKSNTEIILKAEKASLLSYTYEVEENEPIEIELDLNVLYKEGNLKPHRLYDVAVVKIIDKDMPIKGVNIKKRKGRLVTVNSKSIKPFKDILIGNDVFIFGYPSSLGIRGAELIDYKKPLLRKGVVAGLNSRAKTIIIDCPVYFGNSGGPVIEIERVDVMTIKYQVIGLVAQLVPFMEEWVSKQYPIANAQIENSGYSIVVPIDYILELIETMHK